MSLAAGARKPLTLGPPHSVVRIALNARLSAEAAGDASTMQGLVSARNGRSTHMNKSSTIRQGTVLATIEVLAGDSPMMLLR